MKNTMVIGQEPATPEDTDADDDERKGFLFFTTIQLIHSELSSNRAGIRHTTAVTEEESEDDESDRDVEDDV